MRFNIKNELKIVILKSSQFFSTFSTHCKRIKIEHVFGRLKMFRHLLFRYDKLLHNFSGFTFLAMSIIGLNIIKTLK